MAKRSVIYQIEVLWDGIIGVKFAVLYEDDGEVVNFAWHRTTFAPGMELERVLEAANAALETLYKAPPIEKKGIELLRTIVEVTHTPEVVETYRLTLERDMHPIMSQEVSLDN